MLLKFHYHLMSKCISWQWHVTMTCFDKTLKSLHFNGKSPFLVNFNNNRTKFSFKRSRFSKKCFRNPESSMVSGLCPNFSKCEKADIGLLKDAKVALCGLKSLDLT